MHKLYYIWMIMAEKEDLYETFETVFQYGDNCSDLLFHGTDPGKRRTDKIRKGTTVRWTGCGTYDLGEPGVQG